MAKRTGVVGCKGVPPLGGCGGAADAKVGDGAVDLGLLPPLLELLLAADGRELVQLLNAVVVHHAVTRRPVVQVHRDAPEVLKLQNSAHFFCYVQLSALRVTHRGD